MLIITQTADDLTLNQKHSAYNNNNNNNNNNVKGTFNYINNYSAIEILNETKVHAKATKSCHREVTSMTSLIPAPMIATCFVTDNCSS